MEFSAWCKLGIIKGALSYQAPVVLSSWLMMLILAICLWRIIEGKSSIRLQTVHTRIRTLGHSYIVVVFMAAQPSKDGRLGGSPQNSYAGRHPSKRFVQGIAAFHQCPILPKVGELMVNNQQYDSHDAECFIVDRSTPCLRAWGWRRGRVRKTQRYFPWRTVV